MGYQRIENPEDPWESRSWKKQPWKNPLYVDELAFGEGYNSELGQLHYKYFELWRCVYHGIRKFRHSQLYDKILNALPPEKLSFEQIESYLEKHFFLKDSISTIIDGDSTMDIHITPNHPWITPILGDMIKGHIEKKCQIKQVNIELEDNSFF